MEKVAPNSKFIGHFNRIIRQSKNKGSLKENNLLFIQQPLVLYYRLGLPKSNGVACKNCREIN